MDNENTKAQPKDAAKVKKTARNFTTGRLFHALCSQYYWFFYGLML